MYIMCIYVREKEQKKNKVSMETKELCIIGNNTSERSQVRHHKAGLERTWLTPRCPAQSTLLFYSLRLTQSVQCNKYKTLLTAEAASSPLGLFLG